MLQNLTANEIFGLFGLLLIIGFLADYLFKKTNFPDILMLLGLGYLIGPILHIFDPVQLTSVSQLIANLALIIIIFNGGIGFDFAGIISNAPRALALAVLGVAFSIFAISWPVHYLYDWPLLNSLLLGTIIGGTSSATIIALVSHARIKQQVSSLLSLESVLNSPFIIVLALILIEAITSGETGISLSAAGQAILLRFSLGITIGAFAGMVWLWMLSLMQKESYNDIVTLAVVFLMYFMTESINGSGVIFALVFGIMLGNGVSLSKKLKFRTTIESTLVMKGFTAEIYFFIKTFFFIYLGAIVSFSHPEYVIFGIVAAFVLLFARMIAVLLSSAGNNTLLENLGMLTTMLARGESAAVLVQLVAVSQIPNAELYTDIVMAVIITTTLISTAGVIIFAEKGPKELKVSKAHKKPDSYA